MGPQDIDALVNITLGVGGVIIALLVLVASFAWKIASGLAVRDAELVALRKALERHEAECAEWQGKVDARLKEGGENFTVIKVELAKIRQILNGGR